VLAAIELWQSVNPDAAAALPSRRPKAEAQGETDGRWPLRSRVSVSEIIWISAVGT
jgi:hypothetical protein